MQNSVSNTFRKEKMDKIIITDLKCNLIIGTLPQERERKQDIFLDVTLYCDMKKAGRSDCLMDAIDYSAVESALKETAENSSFFLLEALGESLAEKALTFDGVKKVKLTIRKPGACKYAGMIAIEIKRKSAHS